jgi:hypothetical protein
MRRCVLVSVRVHGVLHNVHFVDRPECRTGVLYAPDTTRGCASIHAPYGSQQAAVFLTG